jgi:hypothetical protein
MSLLPWPRRAERQKDIQSAEAEAARSEREARRARKLADDLRAVSGDEFAQVLVEGLAGRDGSE